MRTTTLWLILLPCLGCGKDEPEDTDASPPTDDSDTDTDTDADSDADTDADSDTDADIACPAGDFRIRVDGWTELLDDFATDALFVIDLDNDGDLDVLRLADSSLQVLMGAGDLMIEPTEPIDLGLVPRVAVTADLDADGDPDLALLDGDGWIWRALNDGAGGFSAPSLLHHSACTAPHDMGAGDLDGDGQADLAIACDGDRWVTLLAGDPAWQLTIQELSPAFDRLALGDVDGDGDLDAILGGQREGEGHLLRNDGASSFSRETFDLDRQSSLLALGDHDGDGDLDLVVSDATEADLTWHRNDGGDGFTAHEMWFWYDTYDPQAYIADTLHCEDLDGDGADEIVVLDGGTSWIWWGTTRGPVRKDLVTGVAWLRPAAEALMADMDGDGTPDAVIGNDDGWLNIRRGDGDGGFTMPSAIDEEHSSATTWAEVDLDGDGTLDVVALMGCSVTFWIHQPHTTTFELRDSWTHPTFEGCYGSLELLQVGDLDGDGDPDVMTGAAYDDDDLRVLFTDGSGRVEREEITDVGLSRRQRGLALGDVDGDGDLDAVMDTGSDDIFAILINDGVGGFSRQHDVELDNAGLLFLLEDFDVDGALDLMVLRGSGSQVSLALGNGDGTFAEATTVNMGVQMSEVVVADLDEDGLPDLLATSSLVGDTLGHVHNDGAGQFSSAPLTLSPEPPEPSMVHVDDLDGDGHPDLFVRADYDDGDEGWGWYLPDGSGGWVSQGVFQTPGRTSYEVPLSIGHLNSDDAKDVLISMRSGTLAEVALYNECD